MGFLVQSENEAYGWMLGMHLRAFTRRLKAMPEEHWDWTPDVAAPSARILAAHAWQWLICDRYHIEIPDVSSHPPVPDVPTDPAEMIAAFELETEIWLRMIAEMTPQRLDAPVWQFGEVEGKGNVRGFICHMIQNVIYKHGQFSELYFALGLDGTDPYDAPWPNPIYAEVRGD
jgi:hypothetical protein